MPGEGHRHREQEGVPSGISRLDGSLGDLTLESGAGTVGLIVMGTNCRVAVVEDRVGGT